MFVRLSEARYRANAIDRRRGESARNIANRSETHVGLPLSRKYLCGGALVCELVIEPTLSGQAIQRVPADQMCYELCLPLAATAKVSAPRKV